MRQNIICFVKFSLLTINLILVLGSCKGQNPPWKVLLPDVSYANKISRTYVFSRTQLIYSPGNNNYLHRWIDRPLFINPNLDIGKTDSDLMSPSSFMQMQQMGKEYSLDGFAFFPQTSRRSLFYKFASQNDVKNFSLLNEFYKYDKKSILSIIKLALANPKSFKINGKVVFTSYNADKTKLASWQDIVSEIKGTYGDKIIFLPSIVYFGSKPLTYWEKKYHNNDISQGEISDIKEYLRDWAKQTDGLYFSGASELIDKDRNFDADFYNNFVIRIMKNVLAEPELHKKYLGLSAVVGHENSTRFGYTLSSDGTKTLRASFEAAMKANPDIINIPEWDEQNENTSLSPTVDNGLSSMRIMRYYTSLINKRPLTPVNGDNTALPDLILSYRKILVLGEKLKIEMLNVPDQSNSEPYTAKLKLKNIDGQEVYSSPVFQFNGNELQDNTLSIASEQLSENSALVPYLELQYKGKTMFQETGFHYIELRPTWNWDYKWVKQPIRDLIQPKQINFRVENTSGKEKKITASITADENLAYAEILDNDDVMYSASPDLSADMWHENDKQVIIKIAWQAFGGVADGLNLNGKISLQNSNAKWLLPGTETPVKVKLDGQTLLFDKQKASIWKQRVLVAIPRTDIDKANLSIDMQGIYRGNLPVKKIISEGLFGISGPAGLNIVLSEYSRQDVVPPFINNNNVAFKTVVTPGIPGAILDFQIISKTGHEYRDNPVLANAASIEKKSISVYSDTKKSPIILKVPSNYVPDIVYQFNPQHGSALITNAGRPFCGILGGYFALVSEQGGGNAGDDIPFINKARDYPANAVKTAPDWLKIENNQYALQFDGKGTFVSLPQGVIPRRAGFTIEMDIKPDNGVGKQVIITNRSIYEGSITVFMQNGGLDVNYNGETGHIVNKDCGVQLPIGQWSHLTIRCDQSTIIVSVNGQAGKTVRIPGPGIYDTATSLGGFGKEWFSGLIKSLRIRHSVD